MNRLIWLSFLVCGLLMVRTASAHSFNLALSAGGHETAFPADAYGLLVVDTAGDGFDFLQNGALLQGAHFKSAGSFLGDDDIILAANLPLADFGSSRRGFSLPYARVSIADLGALAAIAPGQQVALVWFPNGRSNPGDTFRFFRTDAAAPGVAAASGFVVPGAGHSSAIAAVSQPGGGHIPPEAFLETSGIIESTGPLDVDWAPIFSRILQGQIGDMADVAEAADITRFAAFNLSWKKIKPRVVNGLTILATVSGRVTVDGAAFTVSGSLSDTGLLLLTFKHKNRVIQTQLQWQEDTARAGFYGTLPLSGEVSLALALSPASHRGTKADSSPHFGKKINTVLFHADDSPVVVVALGHGFLRVTFKRNGTAAIVGRLPDGTAFTAAARAVTNADGSVRLFFHRVLPSKRGHLLGEFDLPLEVDVFTGQPDLTGTVRWLKAAQPKSLFSPAAFTAHLDAQGMVWIKPAGNLLAGAPGHAFHLDFDREALTPTGFATLNGIWNDRNKPLLVLPPKGVKFTFAAATGLISGKLPFIENGKTKSAAWQGIVLPRAIPVYLGEPAMQGFGYLFTRTHSGTVELRPATP